MARLLLLLLLFAACRRHVPTPVPVVLPADSFRFTTTICDTLHDTVEHRVNHTTVRLIREPGRLQVQVKRDTIHTTAMADCPPPPEAPWWHQYMPWAAVVLVIAVLWLVKK